MAEKIVFPQGFLWGSATASYQLEGAVNEDGRGPSIWDTFSATPGKVKNGDSGAIACDHYHRYKEDVQLMKRIGMDAYRFSVAWPRVIPEGTGAVNQVGLDFYDRLVDELLANGIQPYATLYHWDLPQALEDKGGWPNRATAHAYVNYADVVTQKLGDRVKNWMTFNEPWVFTFLGYGMGIHAPGRTDLKAAVQAVHHFLLAHTRAMSVIRHNGDAQTRIGLVMNPNWSDPASDSDADKAAARRWMGFFNDWFLDPIYKGDYPDFMKEVFADFLPEIEEGDLAEIHEKGRPDYLGVNFYTRSVVANDPQSFPPMSVKMIPQPQNEHTEMDWEVSPEGIYNIIMRMHTQYSPGDIYITENGAAFNDVVENGEVHDERRVAYYRAYLANIHRAIQDGAPVKGYFAWSLMDNFEWAEGYTKRFGITYVDYETQERILKDSGKWYSQAIADNGFVPPEA